MRRLARIVLFLCACHAVAADAQTTAPPGQKSFPDLDKAIAFYTGEIQLDPNDANALAARGNAYFGKYDLDDAIADYTQVIKLKPEYVPAYDYRGVAYLQQRKFDQAISDFNEATDRSKNDMVALRNRGSAYYAKLDYDAAISDFTNVTRLAPNDAPAFIRLAEVYAKKSDYDHTVANLDKALRIDPGQYQALNDRCWLRATVNRELDIALADCNAALALKPSIPAFLDSRGFVYFRMGDFQKAMADFDAALAKVPKFAGALYRRGLARNRSDNTVAGQADIAAALALDTHAGDEMTKLGILPLTLSADAPAVHVLPCLNICAQSTPATATDPPRTVYPANAQLDGVEAFVQLRYTVGTDGTVKDVTVLHLIGPNEFADAAITATKNRKFTPATLNGQPVEQSLLISQIFSLTGPDHSARAEVVLAYRQAVSLVQDNKNDEALAVLQKAQSEPRLDFYERGMMASIMAAIYNAKGDYLDAQSLVFVPTTFFPGDVPQGALNSMLNERIVADLKLGDIEDAWTSGILLGQLPGVTDADPALKMVRDRQTKINAAPSYTMLRRIPSLSDGGGDYFVLTRRTFMISGITGSLDKFSMNCRQQTVVSKVVDQEPVHVPKDWSQCSVLVEGTPGTTFRVTQATE